MFLLQSPQVCELEPFTSMPEPLRRRKRSDWADANRGGVVTDSFLEGPVWGDDGNLYVTDIPWGRVFRIDPQGAWTLAQVLIDAAVLLEQARQARAHGRYRQALAHRVFGVGRPAQGAGQLLYALPVGVDFLRALGDVAAVRPKLQPAFVELGDVAGARQQVVVDLRGGQRVRELRLFLRQPLHVGLDQRQLLPSLGQPLAGVFVQQGDVALGQQLVALLACGVQRLQQRRHAADALQPAGLLRHPLMLLAGLVQLRGGGLQRLVLRLPVLGAQQVLFEVFAGGLEVVACLVVQA